MLGLRNTGAFPSPGLPAAQRGFGWPSVACLRQRNPIRGRAPWYGPELRGRSSAAARKRVGRVDAVRNLIAAQQPIEACRPAEAGAGVQRRAPSDPAGRGQV